MQSDSNSYFSFFSEYWQEIASRATKADSRRKNSDQKIEYASDIDGDVIGIGEDADNTIGPVLDLLNKKGRGFSGVSTPMLYLGLIFDIIFIINLEF